MQRARSRYWPLVLGFIALGSAVAAQLVYFLSFWSRLSVGCSQKSSMQRNSHRAEVRQVFMTAASEVDDTGEGGRDAREGADGQEATHEMPERVGREKAVIVSSLSLYT